MSWPAFRPDYFSKTGQFGVTRSTTGEAMRKENFHWWIARSPSPLRTVDVVRMDHFRGFAAAWEVPGADKTAENGAG